MSSCWIWVCDLVEVVVIAEVIEVPIVSTVVHVASGSIILQAIRRIWLLSVIELPVGVLEVIKMHGRGRLKMWLGTPSISSVAVITVKIC